MAQMAAVTAWQSRHIDPRTLDCSDRGWQSYPADVRRILVRESARRLEKLGVKVLTGTKVEKVDEQGVIAGGKRILSATVCGRQACRFSGRQDGRCPDRPSGRLPVDPS